MAKPCRTVITMNADRLARFLSDLHRYPAAKEAERQRFLNLTPYKEAAVLLAVLPHDGQWQILLTRRTDTISRHKGEISLPGGRREAQDSGSAAAALRETHEETGLAPELWQTFPPLPELYTPSGYRVCPVPALCRQAAQPQPNPDEVAEVIYLPLAFALDPHNYRTRLLQYQGRGLEVPALPYLHHDIWGLTAVILYGLAERYAAYSADRIRVSKHEP